MLSDNWLAPNSCLAFGRSCFPKCASGLGLHVVVSICDLFQPEMVDMVEGANTSRSFGLAFCRLSLGLAGNGRRRFLGCEPERTAAGALNLVLGDIRNVSWCDSALDRGPIRSARRAPFTRMGGNVRSHPAASLRTFQIVALLWQSLGVKAKAIMSAPLRSTSLGEFWGKRWNLGFRQLSHELIFRPLHRRLSTGVAGFLVFVLSGLIQDLVISLPARGGYGLPTIYFLIQGSGMTIEHSRLGERLGLRQGVRGWCFMMVFLTAPVFWLFHPWFVLRVILPFTRAIHAL